MQTRSEFNNRKNILSNSDSKSLLQNENKGKILYEKIMYANKDEQEYFHNKKIYT